MPQTPRSSCSETIWLFLAAFISITGLSACLFFLVSLLPLNINPSALSDTAPQTPPTAVLPRDRLDQAYQHYLNQDYAGCLSILQQLSPDPIHHQHHQSLEALCALPLAEGWLMQARQLQQQGQYGEALAIAANIQQGPHHAEAQSLIDVLTRQIIAEAQRLYALPDGNGYSPAIQLLKYIQPNHPDYAEAQALMDQFQLLWTTNSDYWQTAHAAREVGNLPLARQAASQISQGHPFWAICRRQMLEDIQVRWNTADMRLQQAQQALARQDYETAMRWVQGLPDYAPWIETKHQILNQAQSPSPQRHSPPRGSLELRLLGIGMLGGALISQIGR